MTIELRLTEVDPPTEEPHRTIYHDIQALPDPVIQGITIRYFNFDDVALYMQITGLATGYTFTPVNLGLLASGANDYQNLDNFASRAKPTVAQLPNGEMGENITLILKGYTDAGYTTLKWTFERVVTVIWINSADAAFTVDELDNFDDGTIEGWEHVIEEGTVGVNEASHSFAVSTTYVLSAPYSSLLAMSVSVASSSTGAFRWNISKAFTTPNKSEVYAIIDLRYQYPYATAAWCKWLQVYEDATLLIHIGRQTDTVQSSYHSKNKWIRIVVPLTRNSTVTVKIRHDTYVIISGSGSVTEGTYIDDFKIISK